MRDRHFSHRRLLAHADCFPVASFGSNTREHQFKENRANHPCRSLGSAHASRRSRPIYFAEAAFTTTRTGAAAKIFSCPAARVSTRPDTTIVCSTGLAFGKASMVKVRVVSFS